MLDSWKKTSLFRFSLKDAAKGICCWDPSTTWKGPLNFETMFNQLWYRDLHLLSHDGKKWPLPSPPTTQNQGTTKSPACCSAWTAPIAAITAAFEASSKRRSKQVAKVSPYGKANGPNCAKAVASLASWNGGKAVFHMFQQNKAGLLFDTSQTKHVGKNLPSSLTTSLLSFLFKLDHLTCSKPWLFENLLKIWTNQAITAWDVQRCSSNLS